MLVTRGVSFSDRPLWLLGKTSNQTITAETKVTWEKEIAPSVNVQVDLSNNRVYILQGGVYVVSYIGSHTSGGENYGRRIIYVNGAEYSDGTGHSRSSYRSRNALTIGGGHTWDLILSPGDYVEVYHEDAGGIDINATESVDSYSEAMFHGYWKSFS